VLGAGATVSSVSLLAAAVVTYGWYEWRSVDRVGVDTDDAAAGEPVNFLLVGSDSREGEGADQEAAVQGKRTDTIMLLRLDPQSEEVTILSSGCRSPARESRAASTRPTTRPARSRCWSTRSGTRSASR
jgi:anionic cell wall polymer biosynthesis LytR-Cps2A-Psr (LCP) family protein